VSYENEEVDVGTMKTNKEAISFVVVCFVSSPVRA
jgi:hypothetical protein